MIFLFLYIIFLCFFLIALFDENDDVSGKNIYKQEEGFKRGKMIDKAKSCVTEKIKNPFVYINKIDTLKANTSRKNGLLTFFFFLLMFLNNIKLHTSKKNNNCTLI